jgi:hypothetical protein
MAEYYGIFIDSCRVDPDPNLAVSPYNFHSKVIVFDITTTTDIITHPDEVSIQVKPLFQYHYVYLSNLADHFSASTDDGQSIDVNYSFSNPEGYVLPYPKTITDTGAGYSINYSQIEEYFIKDISFMASLYNEQNLNYGDENYSPYNDIGSYFTQYEYSYYGQNISNSLDLNDISYFLGWISFIPNPWVSIPAGILSTALSTPDFLENQENKNVTFNDRSFSVVSGFQNRDDQIAYYEQIDPNGEPRLSKVAGAIVRTSSGKSIKFSTNDYANMYYKINHSALNDQVPEYTRFVREIGLTITNSDESISMTSTSAYSYPLREPVEKPITVDGNDNIYLLNNGHNYFAFHADYTSKYTIKIDSPEWMTIKIGDSVYSGSNLSILKTLYSGSDTIIEVYGNNNRCIAPLTISPDISLNNISINGSDSYLIKLPSLTGVKSLKTNDPDVNIQFILKLNNSTKTFELYDDYGQISEYNEISYPFMGDNYYLILYNYSGVQKIINMTMADPTVAPMGSSITVSLNPNYTYYKISASSTGGQYIFTFNNPASNLVFSAVNQYMVPKTGTWYPGKYYELSLDPSEICYVGIKYDNDSIGTLPMTVNKSSSAFAWEIIGGPNGSSYSVKTYSSLYNLSRGYSYKLKFWVNNQICQTDNLFSEDRLGYGISIDGSGNLYIPLDTPVGGIGIIVKASYGTDVSYNHTIDIIPSITRTFQLAGTYESANDIGFNWIYQNSVEKIYYHISSGTGVNYKEISNVGLAEYYFSNGVAYPQSIMSDALDLLDSNGPISITVTRVDYKDINGVTQYFGYYANTSISGKASSGSGTVSSPYQIKNYLHLFNIRNNPSSYYILMNNLDLSPFGDWITIPSFSGNLNGNGYSIQNMRIYKPAISYSTTQYFGFIGRNYGTINNINLTGINILCQPYHGGSWVYVGGLAASNESTGYIDDVFCQGAIEVHRTYSSVGGINGINTGIIRYGQFGSSSSSRSLIRGNGDLAGISGTNIGTTIYSNTYNTDIKSWISYNNRSIGGIVGYNYGGGIVSYCNIYNSTILHEGSGGISSSALKPYMGLIIGCLDNSSMKYVGYSNSILSPGSLTGSQKDYFGKGPWGSYGWKFGTCYVI